MPVRNSDGGIAPMVLLTYPHHHHHHHHHRILGGDHGGDAVHGHIHERRDIHYRGVQLRSVFDSFESHPLPGLQSGTRC